MVTRGRLVYQHPDPEWPLWDYVPPNGTGYPTGPNGTVDPPPPPLKSQDRDLAARASPPQFHAPHIEIQAWSKPLFDGSVGVVVMNRAISERGLTVTWEMVGLEPGTTAVVRDLWLRKDMGTFCDTYNVSVPGHDAAALRITPARAPAPAR